VQDVNSLVGCTAITLTGFSNMAVPIYQTAQCHIAGDSKLETHHHNNL